MFKKFTNGCVRVVNRWLPDAFLFAIILTLVVFVGAMCATGMGPIEIIAKWGDQKGGFWNLLAFSMQMALVLVFGSAMASAKPCKKALRAVAGLCHNDKQAILVTTFVSTICCWLNWGFGLVIGALAFSGSMVAFAKLEGLLPGKALLFPFQHPLNLLLSIITVLLFFGYSFTHAEWMFWLLAAVSLLLGLLLVLPVGGADMPIVISVLNSYSGWAAVGIGFMLSQTLMIITGTIVGASGAILAFVMTKAMNSSLVQVMLGGAAKNRQNAETGSGEKGVARSGSPEDAAFIMENAEKIIIVPGYGMAAARAQHALKEMAGLLRRKYDVQVRFAIHPVAGRMPGHMNVLLAEADVPYDEIFEMDDINRDFADADVAYVIGANDITNPLAKTDPSSPIYGMPVLDVAAAKTVFFVKRSLSSGYSGVDNPLFYNENTIMLYGDAKAVTEAVVKQLEK